MSNTPKVVHFGDSDTGKAANLENPSNIANIYHVSIHLIRTNYEGVEQMKDFIKPMRDHNNNIIHKQRYKNSNFYFELQSQF